MGDRSSRVQLLTVAIVAVGAALVGTAIAGPLHISFSKHQSKQVKRIARKQANKAISKRAPKLSVKSARSATNASTAASATQAMTALNSTKLGGLAAAGYQHRVRWALVSANDQSIVKQSGGITIEKLNTGQVILGFGENVKNMGILLTPNYGFVTSGRFDVAGDPCGTGPGETDCLSAARNDGKHVYVEVADSFGNAAGNQDGGFYIALLP